ncbi:MAG: hypothetical protein JWL75_87 [Parcubacteria group bacterium]|nr:hypothetical protein [Parcubacteria group bacterium]
MYELSIVFVLLTLIVPSIFFGALMLFCIGRVLHVPDLSLQRSLKFSGFIGSCVLILGIIQLFVSEYVISSDYLTIYESCIPYFNVMLVFLGTLFVLHERLPVNRWKILVLTFASLIIGVGAGYVSLFGAEPYIHMDAPTVSHTSTQAVSGEMTPDSNKIAMEYHELFKSSTYSIECYWAVTVGDSNACNLYAKDAQGVQHNLNLFADSLTGSLFTAPDKKHFVVITEASAVLVDTNTLEKKEILHASKGTWLGYNTNLPSFKAKAVWLDSSTIQIPLYSEGTQTDTEPKPITTKTITI